MKNNTLYWAPYKVVGSYYDSLQYNDALHPEIFMEPYDKPGQLMITTQVLLKGSQKTLPEIYKDTGIPFYWLRKFRTGEMRNPSVNRVQYLYEYLKGESIRL